MTENIVVFRCGGCGQVVEEPGNYPMSRATLCHVCREKDWSPETPLLPEHHATVGKGST